MKLSRPLSVEQTMKRMFCFAFAVLTLFVAGCQTPIPTATGGASVSPPEIVVTGTGEIMVKPDIAYLSLGIVSRDKNAAGASTANATRTQAVMDSLKKAGIAEEYLRTEGYNLRADYTYTRDTQVFKGYVVSNAVRVTVRNVANVGKVLDAAVQSGANSVGQVRFDIADASKASDAALQKAIADATRQAKVAAKSANVSRIGLTQVMVGGNTPRSDGYDNDAGDLSALSLRQRRPVFQAGQQSVAVTVTARFRLFSDAPVLTQ